MGCSIGHCPAATSARIIPESLSREKPTCALNDASPSGGIRDAPGWSEKGLRALVSTPECRLLTRWTPSLLRGGWTVPKSTWGTLSIASRLQFAPLLAEELVAGFARAAGDGLSGPDWGSFGGPLTGCRLDYGVSGRVASPKYRSNNSWSPVSTHLQTTEIAAGVS